MSNELTILRLRRWVAFGRRKVERLEDKLSLARDQLLEHETDLEEAERVFRERCRDG